MKIICIGTLDKFSRFYLKIKEELAEKASFQVYSLHLSGFLYTLIRFKFSCFLPLKAWFYALKNKKKYLNVIQFESIYKNIDYRSLASFHIKLSPNSSKKNLYLLSIAYIDIFEKIFKKNSPDVILLIGDSRLSIETCLNMSKQYKIKTYFIEQGPFNSTFFNSHGVNANTKIIETSKNYDNKEITEYVNKFINSINEKKYNRSPIYRGLDYIFDTLFGKTLLFPPDLKNTDTFPSFFTKKTNYLVKVSDKSEKTFLLILQVPVDVNIIYHSPYFSNHYDIIKSIYNNLPNACNLIVREHPLYKNKYDKRVYDFVKRNSINIDNENPLKKALNDSDVVIVNNSTVGVEAIAQNKTVVVLGNSYYGNSKICLKYDGKIHLKNLLENALKFQPNPQNINKFLFDLIKNNLIQGHIKDNDLKAAKHIARSIINQNK